MCARGRALPSESGPTDECRVHHFRESDRRRVLRRLVGELDAEQTPKLAQTLQKRQAVLSLTASIRTDSTRTAFRFSSIWPSACRPCVSSTSHLRFWRSCSAPAPTGCSSTSSTPYAAGRARHWPHKAGERASTAPAARVGVLSLLRFLVPAFARTSLGWRFAVDCRAQCRPRTRRSAQRRAAQVGDASMDRVPGQQ